MTATKDWTKFCQDIRGRNLVQSSALSFPTGGQGHDSKEDWTKSCQDICGQKFGPIISAVIFLPVTKEMTAERIGPNFARTLAGNIGSNPLCCHSLPVTKQRGLNQILP